MNDEPSEHDVPDPAKSGDLSGNEHADNSLTKIPNDVWIIDWIFDPLTHWLQLTFKRNCFWFAKRVNDLLILLSIFSVGLAIRFTIVSPQPFVKDWLIAILTICYALFNLVCYIVIRRDTGNSSMSALEKVAYEHLQQGERNPESMRDRKYLIPAMIVFCLAGAFASATPVLNIILLFIVFAAIYLVNYARLLLCACTPLS